MNNRMSCDTVSSKTKTSGRFECFEQILNLHVCLCVSEVLAFCDFFVKSVVVGLAVLCISLGWFVVLGSFNRLVKIHV